MSVANVSPEGRRGIAWQVTVPSSAAFVGNIVAVEKNTERQRPLKFTEHVLV